MRKEYRNARVVTEPIAAATVSRRTQADVVSRARLARRAPSALPADRRKVLALMPVHVAAQPTPGTYRAELEAECKTRIMAIGRERGATVIDWRIASPPTTENKNYWDRLHYRVPVATQVADQLAGAVLEGRQSDDGTYVILAP